jgi:hypothetical protein
MAVAQSIETAREQRIGGEGVAAADFAAALGRSAEALDWLRARHADGSLPLLRLPAARDDLAAVRAAADRLNAGASDIVLLGTGGSSLGGQTCSIRVSSRGTGRWRRPRSQNTADAILSAAARRRQWKAIGRGGTLSSSNSRRSRRRANGMPRPNTPRR